MICPDWKGLLAHRLELEAAPEPEGWNDAVEHLEECPACRRRAFAIDPSLLFLGQPPLSVSDDEVGQIKANVHTLVRGRVAERASHRLRRRVGRFAAAAAVIALMVVLPTHTSRQVLQAPSALPGLASDPSTFAASEAGLIEAPTPLAPVIEPLDLPAARIYQLGGENFSIVMVVDDSIDV